MSCLRQIDWEGVVQAEDLTDLAKAYERNSEMEAVSSPCCKPRQTMTTRARVKRYRTVTLPPREASQTVRRILGEQATLAHPRRHRCRTPCWVRWVRVGLREPQGESRRPRGIDPRQAAASAGPPGTWPLRSVAMGSIVVRNGVEQGQLVRPEVPQTEGIVA